MTDLKVSLGNYYKTRSGETVKLISIRSEHYLGISVSGIPFTFWYKENGRLYSDGISPNDLIKEVISKIEFKTRVEQLEDRLRIKWPKGTHLKDLAGSNVKVTIELLDE